MKQDINVFKSVINSFQAINETMKKHCDEMKGECQECMFDIVCDSMFEGDMPEDVSRQIQALQDGME